MNGLRSPRLLAELLKEVGIPPGSVDDKVDRVVTPLSIFKLAGIVSASATTSVSSCWTFMYRNRSAYDFASARLRGRLGRPAKANSTRQLS